MISMKHFHLNNNSFSGQLPPELSEIKNLVHLLLDNNNLSGYLPSQFSALSNLEIIQLDNNNFDGAVIPESYPSLSKLVKLDLSWNKLTGYVRPDKLLNNITTIDLSHNKLIGPIPKSFLYLSSLQVLSLQNNRLKGSVPSQLWQNKSLTDTDKLSIDLRYNLFSDIVGDLNPPESVNIRLRGNPVCNITSIKKINSFCDSDAGGNWTIHPATSSRACHVTACPVDQFYEPVPEAPTCFCAAPIRIGYRLKSPSFTYFPPYISTFESYITDSLNMELHQLFLDSYAWEEGPRLRMDLKLFPNINALGRSHIFNDSELSWIKSVYTTWDFPGSKLFGPYELLNFTLLGPYISDSETGKSGINKFLLAAIIIGAIVCAITASVIINLFILRRNNKYKQLRKIILRRGGYGKVYKGTLDDDTVVAVKRADEGSFQGTREFLTEIHLLSRLHHRNLVSLVEYCGENGEQMLVYEFMPNGTSHDWLSGKFEKSLDYCMRLRIALGSAKGILYLHREANPPVFHRDVKASNILLDLHMIAKVADFGLSRLAPVLNGEGDLCNDHVSTVVKGTPGYIDPEYFLTQELTDKSDVYRLGVVFLELLTGVPPILHGKNLVREVNMAHESGSLSEIIDSRMTIYSSVSLERFIDLAMRCCQYKPQKRPSMLDVVRELDKILQMIPPENSTTQSASSSTTLSKVYPRTLPYVPRYDSVSAFTLSFTPR